jgi:hypothetical protein
MMVSTQNDGKYYRNDDGVISIDDTLQQQQEQIGQQLNHNKVTTTVLDTEQQQVPVQIDDIQSKDEMIKILSERYVLQLSPEEDELLDPIERTIRYIIPIPKKYYWDILPSSSSSSKQQEQHDCTTTNNKNIPITINDVPYSIKVWHHCIHKCDVVGTWINNHVAQPIASSIGLTGPRFFEVITSMTEEELQQSRTIMNERNNNQQQQPC